MRLSHLHLEQFRCYERLELALPEVGLRLAGPNASGKTSLLEAIQLLATMRSARAGVERELINWESNEEFELPPYSRVVGTWTSNGETGTIEVALSADPQRLNHTRKQVKLDGQARRAIDAVGRLKVVLFEPEDMDLVLGGPSVRRRYLDIAMSSLDTTYVRLLSQYNKIVEQRNSLLKDLRESSPSARGERLIELEYWDQEFINRAAFLIAARATFLERLRAPLTESFQWLTSEKHHIAVAYGPSADFPDGFQSKLAELDIIDAQRWVMQWMEEAIEERRDEEIRRGLTVTGPHRDDVEFLLDGRDLSAFGSRGQQRVAVVSMKLAEVTAVQGASGQTPVLLLDDVLSELDEERRERLLIRVSELGGQVIVTATDARFLESPRLQSLPMFEVQEGCLTAST